MKRRIVIVIIALAVCAVLFGFHQQKPSVGERIIEHMYSAADPALVKKAEAAGLYDRETYPVLRKVNPYYLRGDFNGDGEMDVASWIRNRETDVHGVAILHSTLDTMYVFGAGQPRPPGGREGETEIRAEVWRVIPQGQTDQHHYGNIPEIGAVRGQPFTFERETMEFLFLGKSAFVFYWAKGKYWEFWTAD